MGQEMVEGYAKGYIDGWDRCRVKLCARYKLDVDAIIAWENSDELDAAHDAVHAISETKNIKAVNVSGEDQK